MLCFMAKKFSTIFDKAGRKTEKNCSLLPPFYKIKQHPLMCRKGS